MTQSVIKHIRFYFLFNKSKLMNLFEYRSDTISIILGSLGYVAMTYIFIEVLFSKITNIGSWGKYEMVALFGVAQILYYLLYCLVGDFQSLSDAIRTGSLDKSLTKPLHTFFLAAIDQSLLIQTLPSLIIPFMLLGHANNFLEINWYSNLIVFGLSLIVSIFQIIFFYGIIGSLAFWLSDTKGISTIYWSVKDFEHFPGVIYPRWAWPIILTIFPSGLIAYVPTSFLLNGFDWNLFIMQMFSFVFLSIVLYWFWKTGLKNYTSASS